MYWNQLRHMKKIKNQKIEKNKEKNKIKKKNNKKRRKKNLGDFVNKNLKLLKEFKISLIYYWLVLYPFRIKYY